MNTATAITSEAVIVLGVHRSGTSALTGTLGQMGLYPGPSLIPGIKDVNAKGFWEHPGIVDVHDRLLESLGSSWHDVKPMRAGWWLADDVAPFRAEIEAILERDFVSQSRWVVKDPRICRILPLWQVILANLAIKTRYLITLRHPLAVAASLEKRDEIPMAHGCLLWLAYMMESERYTRQEQRSFVSYDRLVCDWRKEIAKITDELGLDLGKDNPATIDAFIDPSLRHHNLFFPDHDHPAITAAIDCFTRLEASHSEEEIILAMDDSRPEYERLVRLVNPWSDAINTLRYRETQARAETALHKLQYEKEIARIKSSISWRITAPLRASWNLVLYPILGRLGLHGSKQTNHRLPLRSEKHRH